MLHVSFFNVQCFLFFSSSRSIFLCRQGNLPVALIFDYPDESVDPDAITMLGSKLGVFIALRQKSRQHTLCLVIKGVEKFVGQWKSAVVCYVIKKSFKIAKKKK